MRLSTSGDEDGQSLMSVGVEVGLSDLNRSEVVVIHRDGALHSYE